MPRRGLGSLATGSEGESAARHLLSPVASLAKPEPDTGKDDLVGQLLDRPKAVFFVQAKASASPTYRDNEILSLPIELDALATLLSMPGPSFVFMTDTLRGETYYLRLEANHARPSQAGEQTRALAIPLANKLTRENVGDLVRVVVHGQRVGLDPGDAGAFLDQHFRDHPDLYHDLREVDRLLEVLRGSDGDVQFQTVQALKERAASGWVAPTSLRRGLLALLINCKDRITQNYVVDLLAGLGVKEAIPELLRQVGRNTRMLEYRWTSPQMRHTFVEFLFRGLVNLRATRIGPQLPPFLTSRDPAVVREAVRTVGELGLRRLAPQVLPHLSSKDEGVRWEASHTVGRLRSASLCRTLMRSLRNRTNEMEAAGAVLALAEMGEASVADAILHLVADSSPHVRRAVAVYVGAVKGKTGLQTLIALMRDEEWSVRQAALGAANNCLRPPSPPMPDGEVPPPPPFGWIESDELEQLLLPVLQAEFRQGRLPQVDCLGSLLSRCIGPASITALVEIYLTDPGTTHSIRARDLAWGGEIVQGLNAKVWALDILAEKNVAAIGDDIVQNIRTRRDDTTMRYVMAAGKLRLTAAFEPLCALLGENPTLGDWGGPALLSIDRERAVGWAIAQLQTGSDLGMFLTCEEMLRQAGSLTPEIDACIRANVLRFLASDGSQQERRLFWLVERLQLAEAVPTLIAWVTAGARDEHVEYAMLRALAATKNGAARDFLIALLGSVDARGAATLMRLLAEVADDVAFAAVAAQRENADEDVAELADSLLRAREHK